jgi:hypothetical protein
MSAFFTLMLIIFPEHDKFPTPSRHLMIHIALSASPSVRFSDTFSDPLPSGVAHRPENPFPSRHKQFWHVFCLPLRSKINYLGVIS